jgi:outer membrane protein assembly factor BamB
MISAATPQRYGALTALVTGFQSTIRSRNGGQEMNMNRQPQKRPWIIAGLLVLALLSTAMTGCDKATVPDSVNRTTSQTVSGTVSSTNQTVSGTVNRTFVDVNGLLTAPTKVTMSYHVASLNTEDVWSTFLDGALYAFSDYLNTQHNQSGIQMTVWDQATGKKLWSLDMKQNWSTHLASDGKRLFFHVGGALSCLDKTTGATIWKTAPSVAFPFVFGANSEIVMHINEKSHVADRLYVIGGEYESLPPQIAYEGKMVAPGTRQKIIQKVRNLGIWILDATTGKLLGRFDLPTLTFNGYSVGELLCDGATLYASIPESTEAEYPTQKSSLVAFDLTTNKMLWQESVDGEGLNLVKQGNVLTFVRTVEYSDRWIDIWQISIDGATRLWTRKIDMATNGYWGNFAVDSTQLYLQGNNGVLMALDLATGKEIWKQQFASYKTAGLEMPENLYPNMTLTTTRDVLYVEDGGGLVTALHPVTGEKLWSKRFSHVAGWFTLQVVDKGFFVVAGDGKVDLWK